MRPVRTIKAGRKSDTAATGTLMFNGFYDLGVMGKAAFDATDLDKNCGCAD